MPELTTGALHTDGRNEVFSLQTFDVALHYPEQPITLIFHHRSSFSDDDFRYFGFDEVMEFAASFTFTRAFPVQNGVAIELEAVLM